MKYIKIICNKGNLIYHRIEVRGGIYSVFGWIVVISFIVNIIFALSLYDVVYCDSLEINEFRFSYINTHYEVRVTVEPTVNDPVTREQNGGYHDASQREKLFILYKDFIFKTKRRFNWGSVEKNRKRFGSYDEYKEYGDRDKSIRAEMKKEFKLLKQDLKEQPENLKNIFTKEDLKAIQQKFKKTQKIIKHDIKKLLDKNPFGTKK